MVYEGQHKKIKTLLSLPEDFDENKKHPLVVFLHGAGTRGNNIEALKQNSGFTKLQAHQDRGFILAAPLCCAHDWFELMETLISWITELRGLSYVDTDRVYLTGNSMGGYGTWELGCIHPEWFAAIMPVCGGGCPGLGAKLKNVPVRTFHGLQDTRVDPIESLQMAKAINRFGGHAELILFPEFKHNCWDAVYTTEDNYDWLFSHTLSSDGEEIEALHGEKYG